MLPRVLTPGSRDSPRLPPACVACGSGVAAVQWFRSHVSSAAWRRVVVAVMALLILGVAGALLALQLLGYTRWTGRSLSLLDPTYAKKFVPIISSVRPSAVSV